MTRRLLLAPFALLATGCLLGPDHERPAVPVPDTWREIQVPEAQTLANTPWWELFGDSTLVALIDIALQENKDLKIAIERVEEARARYGFTKADLWPAVDLAGAAGAIRASEASLVHIPEAGEERDTETGIYGASLNVFWELDFFGRIRRSSQAQNALFLATQEARRAAVLTLVSDVARSYIELRDFDLRLEIARRTVASRREYVQLALDRYQGGVSSELDPRQAEAELHRIEGVALDLERLVGQKENELSVLLGRNPGPVGRGQAVGDQALPSEVPAGLPSELLDRRPDIREAEMQLAALTANIGAAKAMLFPRISLTGSFGYASTDLETVFEEPSRSWNIIGNLVQPLFNAGKNRRRVEMTESQQRQALYAYERTVLQAFRETDDALLGYRIAGEQRRTAAARVAADRKVLELSEMRYRGGVSDYLEVLDAQRSLFQSELEESQLIGNHLVALVQLYKALGGGWPQAPEEAAAEQPEAEPAPPPQE